MSIHERDHSEKLDWLTGVLIDDTLTDSAKVVATFIGAEKQDRASGIRATVADLAEALGKSERTVSRNLHELFFAGWVTITDHGETGLQVAFTKRAKPRDADDVGVW